MTVDDDAARALVASLRTQRLVVCVGPGGVGKTTLAASMALVAAKAGRNTLVLTIDPARRLADALGLDGLDDSLRPVALEAPGTLHAAMLDTKRSYDRLIERIAEPAAALRIRENLVYQAFSKTLARSHAYIAAERLYEVMRDDRFDLVILDTPPTRNALEILDAPTTLSQFLDQDILRYFLKAPGTFPTLASLMRAGGKAALALLAKLAGEGIVKELTSFFEVLADQREGFAERAAANQQTLADKTTLYCLVTSPEAAPLEDARLLADELAARHRAAEWVIFNRAFESELGEYAPCDDARTPLEQRLVDLRKRSQARLKTVSAAAARFMRPLPAAQAWLLAEMREDVQDLDGLGAMWRNGRTVKEPPSSPKPAA